MPLFYFDVHDGVSCLDRVGKNCSDQEAAWLEAARLAERLLANDAGWFCTGQEWQIGVMDTEGAAIFNLHFGSSTDVVITMRTVCKAAAPSMSRDRVPMTGGSACEQAN